MNFNQEVIERSHHIPIVVDFSAKWCGPCRMVKPLLHLLASQTDDWKLVEIDVDSNIDLAKRYMVMSIPAIYMFVKGELIAEYRGLFSSTDITRWIEKNSPTT